MNRSEYPSMAPLPFLSKIQKQYLDLRCAGKSADEAAKMLTSNKALIKQDLSPLEEMDWFKTEIVQGKVDQEVDVAENGGLSHKYLMAALQKLHGFQMEHIDHLRENGEIIEAGKLTKDLMESLIKAGKWLRPGEQVMRHSVTSSAGNLRAKPTEVEIAGVVVNPVEGLTPEQIVNMPAEELDRLIRQAHQAPVVHQMATLHQSNSAPRPSLVDMDSVIDMDDVEL